MSIPTFKYHPDPLATGSIRPSDVTCVCCGQTRGYIYTASVYAPGSYQNCICPWCIADGSAAEKLDAIFADDSPLTQAGLSDDVINEVTLRTPGYNSWQQEVWLACCDDACEYHGDASTADLKALQGDALTQTLGAWRWREKDWTGFVGNYQPGGNPAVYKFRCRHCKTIQYGVDFT